MSLPVSQRGTLRNGCALNECRALRAVAVAYAAGTTLVVIATANHYVLDAIAGIAVMVLAIRHRTGQRS